MTITDSVDAMNSLPYSRWGGVAVIRGPDFLGGLPYSLYTGVNELSKGC
jgi:hypothetical protein